MRILYINNDGGGFADYIEVDPGTSISKLFAQQLPGRKAEDYLIRVNRQPTRIGSVGRGFALLTMGLPV